MKAGKIIDFIEDYAPKSLAMEWDHVGLMLGSVENEIHNVYFCMDFTIETLHEALRKNCNLIITHHPLIWNPLASVSDDTPEGSLIAESVRAGITVYSAHTNLDFTTGGINDALISAIGLDGIPDDSGTHRYGTLVSPITFSAFLDNVREALDAPSARGVLPLGADFDDVITTVGVSSGAFDGDIDWLRECNIDVIVTGEMKHNQAIELMNNGFFAITAGHFESEHPGVEMLADAVKKHFAEIFEKEGIKTVVSKACNPFVD